MEKICLECGLVFEVGPHGTHKLYCSEKCKEAVARRRKAEYKRLHPEKQKEANKRANAKRYGNAIPKAQRSHFDNSWLGRYRAAEARKDVCTQVSMIAKAYSDMPGKQYISYGNLMAIKENNPVKFFKLCSEVISYKDSEEKNHE